MKATCESTVIDNCESGPCVNNGTCYAVPGAFVCKCDYPYGGHICAEIGMSIYHRYTCIYLHCI